MTRVEQFAVDAQGRIEPEGRAEHPPFRLRGYLPGTVSDSYDLVLKRGLWPVLARARLPEVMAESDLQDEPGG